MNLDYRKGSINFSDLNSSTAYDPTIAFNQSQLANMLSVQAMARDWVKNKITVNAVYPGVCSTNIKRHMGEDMTEVRKKLSAVSQYWTGLLEKEQLKIL